MRSGCLFGQAQYNEEAAENALLRPAFCASMARPLYEVYARRFAAGPAEGKAAQSRRWRRADADAEEAAAAQEIAAPEDGPENAHMDADGAPADFDQPPMGAQSTQALYVFYASWPFLWASLLRQGVFHTGHVACLR